MTKQLRSLCLRLLQLAVDVAMASRSLNDVAISDVLDEDSFVGVNSIFDDSDIDPDFMGEDELATSRMENPQPNINGSSGTQLS
ncbi:hypothetical protein J6590_016065 [Homalodisca vitripennis]|nr:hypothetical protein J6590_016065 [Homalodisca vitripennis]